MNKIEVKYVMFDTCSSIFLSICIFLNCIIVTTVIIVVKIGRWEFKFLFVVSYLFLYLIFKYED